MRDGRVPAGLRRIIIARAAGCCEYCQSQVDYATQTFAVEHIVPREKGGATTLDNLALSCQGCNNHKFVKIAARDPLSDLDASLFHPRRDRWSDHFAWNADYTVIIGLTPTGRATIAALHLNRPGLQNLRRVLYVTGNHPPGGDER